METKGLALVSCVDHSLTAKCANIVSLHLFKLSSFPLTPVPDDPVSLPE